MGRGGDAKKVERNVLKATGDSEEVGGRRCGTTVPKLSQTKTLKQFMLHTSLPPSRPVSFSETDLLYPRLTLKGREEDYRKRTPGMWEVWRRPYLICSSRRCAKQFMVLHSVITPGIIQPNESYKTRLLSSDHA